MALVHCLPLRAEDLSLLSCQFQWRHRKLNGMTDDDTVAHAERMGQALVVLMAWQRQWNCIAGDYIPLLCPTALTGDATPAEAALLSPSSAALSTAQ
eukprot:gene38035-13372_t